MAPMNQPFKKKVTVWLAIIFLVASADLDARSVKGAVVELVTLDGESVKGELLVVDEQGLTVIDNQVSTVVPWDDLLHVRIKRTSKALAFLGGGIALGMLGGWAIAESLHPSSFISGNVMTAALSLGGLLGALTGGLLGRSFSKPKAYNIFSFREKSGDWKSQAADQLRPYSRRFREIPR